MTDTQTTYTVGSLINEEALLALLAQRRQAELDAAQALIDAALADIQAVFDEADEKFTENLVKLFITKTTAQAVLSDAQATEADKQAAAEAYKQAMQAIADIIDAGYTTVSYQTTAPVSTSAFFAETPDEERLLRDYRDRLIRPDTEQVSNGDGTFTVLFAWSDSRKRQINTARHQKAKKAAAPAAKPDSTSTDSDSDDSSEPETSDVTPPAPVADDNGSSEPGSPVDTPVPPVPSTASGTTTTTTRPKRKKRTSAAAAPAATSDSTPPVDDTPAPPAPADDSEPVDQALSRLEHVYNGGLATDTPAPPAHVSDDDGSTAEPETPVDIPAVVAPAATDSADSRVSVPPAVILDPTSTGIPADKDVDLRRLQDGAKKGKTDEGSQQPTILGMHIPVPSWAQPVVDRMSEQNVPAKHKPQHRGN